MRSGPVFERAYAHIKARLQAGGFRPGERLEPVALADAAGASLTPVRDALYRLAGERMVEHPRFDGFLAPLLTEPALRDLYRWQELLLLLAVDHRVRAGRSESGARPPATPSSLANAPALFRAIGAASGLAELEFALANTIDRLASVRRAESEVLLSVEHEDDAMIGAARNCDVAGLKHALRAYHKLRAGYVPEIVRRLLRPSPFASDEGAGE